jgi:hypothetical protein
MTKYWKVEEGGKTVAVLRQADKKLPERWSTDRKAWKDAPFHYGEVFGDDRRPTEIKEAEATKLISKPLPDISDSDWAVLSDPSSDDKENE